MLAILFKEPERDDFIAAIGSANTRLLGSVNAFEASIVASRLDRRAYTYRGFNQMGDEKARS